MTRRQKRQIGCMTAVFLGVLAFFVYAKEEESLTSLPPETSQTNSVTVSENENSSQTDQEENFLPDSMVQGPQEPKRTIDVLELKDMDVIDVLKLIAQKSGLNIVAGQNVRGQITIYLKNVDVKDALRIILESNDLAYAEEGGIIRVMTAQEYEMKYGRRFAEHIQTAILHLKHAQAADLASTLNQMKSVIGKIITDDKSNSLIAMDTPEKLGAMEQWVQKVDILRRTEVFALSYAQVEEISSKIAEALTPNIGKLRFDKRSNKIVVTDTEQKITEIQQLIEAFDQRSEEVLIEAKIVQIVLNEEHKMGIDWEAIVSDYHDLRLSNQLNVLGAGEKSGRLSIGTLSQDDYTVLLEALDTVGKTNILSSPRITTLNNQEAKILVGSTEPYVTTTTTTTSTGPATTAESVNFIEVGVKLYVTPTIHRDQFITMKIKPEVSSVTRNIKTSTNNTIPVVETSEAETVVTVKDGVTIVIGGLIKDEKIESIKKIPFLGDIPLIGTVFRNEERLTRKTELVIFLTPKLISGDVQEQLSSKNVEE